MNGYLYSYAHNKPAPSLHAKVWGKVLKLGDGNCWVWLGARAPSGHGHTEHKGKTLSVHCIVYEEAYGPIPDGWFVHHKCGHPCCVNPQHLLACSHGDHNRIHKLTRQCKRGHARTPENIYIYHGQRHCRICARLRMRQWRKR